MRAWRVGVPYGAVVERIVDGDTVRVGWCSSYLERWGPWVIRLARIDAAELRPYPTAAGVAARDALIRLVGGRVVEVIPRRAWPDPYGRMIADIRVEGRDVAHEMIVGGWVQRYSATLRRAARVLAKGAMPSSAVPMKRLIQPPRTITGLPVSMASRRMGVSGAAVIVPMKVNPEV